MSAFHLRVRDIVRETPWSTVVRLDLGASTFKFTAGQAARITHRSNVAGVYSIASSPDQARRTGTIEFLIGTGSARAAGPRLAGLAVGDAVLVTGPFGTFGLPRPLRQRRLLFIAGGTGIAPVRSMILAALAGRNPPATTLLYSAQSPDGFAFVREFSRLSRGGRLRLHLTATRTAGPTWRGRRGRIQRRWLRQLTGDGPTLCFVCGPPAFVEDVSEMLGSVGVPPALIKRETS